MQFGKFLDWIWTKRWWSGAPMGAGDRRLLAEAERIAKAFVADIAYAFVLALCRWVKRIL